MENIEIEIWRDIPDYEGQYQVSNLGRVKSLERSISCKDGRKSYIVPKRIMKLNKDNLGYLNVMLCKNGKIKRFRVHQLVARTFIPNPENLPMINHKNEIKTDNRVENLEFCTAKHNANYGTRNERLSKINKGKISLKRKTILQFTLDNVFIRVWDSATTASKELNINQSNITSCCRGKRNQCGGYVWRFK